jgi:hypothetical protein
VLAPGEVYCKLLYNIERFENMAVFCFPYEHRESLFQLFSSVAGPDLISGAFFDTGIRNGKKPDPV